MIFGLTGANGFVGSHLFSHLNKIGHCEAFDRVKYDLFNIESMKTFVENKDFIFHLAGQNRASDDELIRINTYGTLNFMEALRKYSRDSKIIFASSMQVYGTTPDLEYFDESGRAYPISTYGMSKKCAEDIINNYCNLYGIKGLIFRISNIYGPECRPYYNSAISTFIDLINKDQKIIINGSGQQCRDFIFISDLIDAFEKSLTYCKNVDTINICTGNPVSINEIIKILSSISHKEIKVEYRKDSENDNYMIGNPSKALKIIGFKSKIGIEDGLMKTYSGRVK